MSRFEKIIDSTFIFTLVSILIGFLIGAIVLLIIGFNPILAYGTILDGIFSQPKYMMRVVINATPIIMTGLAVAFAFKTGLFNIGAEGQYIVGSLAAVCVGVFVEAPMIIHPILCILAGALAGAFCAGIAGFLKAQKGVSEVITSIMLNWAALYFSNFVLMNTALKKPQSDASVDIRTTARISVDWFKGIFGSSIPVNLGIVVALVAIVVFYIIINKTTLGYKLRAVGFNKNAALYGGISVTKSTMISMAISGALAGIGGALMITGVQYRINGLAGQEGYGFDGLSVAMIGASNPFGVLFSGLFYSGLKYGGGKLTMIGAPSEVVDIIMGCIIYFIAISSALRQLYLFLTKKKGAKSL